MSCSCWRSEVSEHQESSSSLGPRMGEKLPAPTLVGKTTAKKTLKLLMELVMDNDSTIIGVHGMAGVGKTAIMMNAYNQLLETEQNRFDKVIWVYVSRNADICKLQDSVAYAINLDLSNEQDEVKRAAYLYGALKRMARFVLILDDIWDAFSLDEVGIIEPSKGNGCKLVVTTRSYDVCRRMQCKQDCIVKVELLAKTEAWELFMDEANVMITPEITDIVENVIKECACLPLTIVKVGRAMRGKKGISVWRDALKFLMDSGNGTMEGSVFESLKFSFDRLPHEILRKCFVYCGLYPKDWKILAKELIEYWIMDGIIEEKKRQDELDRGEIILNQLKDNGLLESVDVDFKDCHDWGDGVKMQQLYRVIALHTTSQRFISKCDLMLEELPDEVEWGQVLEGASFMCNRIRKLSISPRCPKLSTLFLNKNPELCTIMPDFFVHMGSLKILDLRDNDKMASLPDSISDLVTLQALRLSRCSSLKKVPSVAKLISMRMLELDETAIEELPHGIELLLNLKFLNLHSLKLKERIPSGFLSGFLSLPQLVLGI